jgi:hypothetical protein
LLTSRNEYDRLGRIHRRDVFTGNAQRPAPARWSRRWDYDYRNNPVREERDDDPFNWCNWKYDSAGRLLEQDGTSPEKSNGAGMRRVTRWITACSSLFVITVSPV